jgi:hypothetical protein
LGLPKKHGNPADKKTSTPYTYIPLDEVSHEIRLLKLHQGNHEDPIKITLTNTPFTVDHAPVFEALSYTWGSPENPIDIFVGQSDSDFGRVLSITKNLREALPYLGLEDRDRVLLIDAICL